MKLNKVDKEVYDAAVDKAGPNPVFIKILARDGNFYEGVYKDGYKNEILYSRKLSKEEYPNAQ